MAETRIQVGPEHMPTDIVLYGFPKAWLERLKQMAQSLDLRYEEPPIYRFENLTFFRKISALYDESGRIVTETRVRRGPQLAKARGELPETVPIPRDARRVAEPVLYGGQLRAHWGHFLTEGISRLWALLSPEVLPSIPVVFAAPKTPLDPVHREVLAPCRGRRRPTAAESEIRAWARSIGLPVSDRGRLRPAIRQAWHDAHRSSAE